jgi:hypothetical protein
MWQHSYHDDPLVLNKSAVPAKGEDTQPVLVARVEPEPPAAPTTALVAAPQPAAHEAAKQPLETADESAPLPGAAVDLIGTAKTPVPVTTAVRADGAVPAIPAAGQWAAGPFGHAPDYSWLQGVIDKHYRGHLELRYADASAEDQWGGKVCLEDAPSLHELKDGDVVLILGEMISEGQSHLTTTWHHFPHYRVRQVTLVRHGT